MLDQTVDEVWRLLPEIRSSGYLWPMTSAPEAIQGALPNSHSDRSNREHLALLWQSVARAERFGQTADRLSATMRRLGQSGRAELYSRRAAQADYRVSLLTSLLEAIDQADASIHAYRISVAPTEGMQRDNRDMLTRSASSSREVTTVSPASGAPIKLTRRQTGAAHCDLEPALTPREREVLALITRGYSNSQIATELVITRGTAQNHVAHILGKYGCRSRGELIARFVPVGNHARLS
jgi:DNA-binding NarL/FixJ family response regulator